jgi:hypothetical protein
MNREEPLNLLVRHVTSEKKRLRAFREAAAGSLDDDGFDFGGARYTHLTHRKPQRAPAKGPRARRGIEFEAPPEPE